LTCRCGAAVDVPSMRGLRDLEPAEAKPVARPGQSWNPGRGAVFSAGLFFAAIGLLTVGYALLPWSRLDTAAPPPADLSQAYATIDKMPPAEALATWDEEVKKRGLGPYVPPPYIMARSMARTLQTIMLVGGAIALLGTAATASSLLFRPRRS